MTTKLYIGLTEYQLLPYCSLRVFTHLILMTSFSGKYYYFQAHFTAEETETWQVKKTCQGYMVRINIWSLFPVPGTEPLKSLGFPE